MNIKEARKICELQGVKFHLVVQVICPYCGEKMDLLIDLGRGICINCRKEKDINEIYEVVVGDWLYEKRDINFDVTKNKGVGY